MISAELVSICWMGLAGPTLLFKCCVVSLVYGNGCY